MELVHPIIPIITGLLASAGLMFVFARCLYLEGKKK